MTQNIHYYHQREKLVHREEILIKIRLKINRTEPRSDSSMSSAKGLCPSGFAACDMHLFLKRVPLLCEV